MHPKDRKIERLLDARAPAYGLRVVRDWSGYNPLLLASPLPHQKQVHWMLNIWSRVYIISIYAIVLKCLCVWFADSQIQHLGVFLQDLRCKIQNLVSWRKSMRAWESILTSRTICITSLMSTHSSNALTMYHGAGVVRRTHPSSNAWSIASLTRVVSSWIGAQVQVLILIDLVFFLNLSTEHLFLCV